nr:hypothetical protein Iba_chr06aCG3320 [Ipomoea batatas]
MQAGNDMHEVVQEQIQQGMFTVNLVNPHLSQTIDFGFGSSIPSRIDPADPFMKVCQTSMQHTPYLPGWYANCPSQTFMHAGLLDKSTYKLVEAIQILRAKHLLLSFVMLFLRRTDDAEILKFLVDLVPLFSCHHF